MFKWKSESDPWPSGFGPATLSAVALQQPRITALNDTVLDNIAVSTIVLPIAFVLSGEVGQSAINLIQALSEKEPRRLKQPR